MGIAGVLLLFLVLVLLPLYVLAANFSGSVVSVIDGDTSEALHKIRAKRIRLGVIDCPENGQAYSERAKQALSELNFA